MLTNAQLQRCKAIAGTDQKAQRICEMLLEKYGEGILKTCEKKKITGADIFFLYGECQKNLKAMYRSITEDLAQQVLKGIPFSSFSEHHAYPDEVRKMDTLRF